MRLPRCLLLGWTLGFAACAAAPAPPPATPATGAAADSASAPLPTLPRSSIAAVVQHREELGLSDDQVRDLEMRDLEREKEDTVVRDEVEQKRKQAQAPKAAPSSGGPSGGAAGGGGMRGGGMRGGGMRGNGPPGPGAAAGEPHPEPSLEDRLDENDTKAYLEGEAFLKDEQREKAREIASDYREKLYDRRVLSRARAAAAK